MNKVYKKNQSITAWFAELFKTQWPLYIHPPPSIPIYLVNDEKSLEWHTQLSPSLKVYWYGIARVQSAL